MSVDLPRRGRYRHFKGGEYEVLHIARHSETDEPLVIYRALYPCPDTPNGEGIWARPLSSWNAPAEAEGKAVPRFIPIADDAPPMPEPPPEEAFFAAPPEMPEMSAAAPAPTGAEPIEAPEDVLKRVFGYASFREGQREVIDAILSGRDVLGVMPTGAGKSICYQVPALAMPGCALVISPLISLMKDQVAALKQAGVAAAFLNSSLTERQMDLALRNLAGGQYKLVYVAPERLLTPRFLSLCRSLPISMVAVDEAHCISQWGQDFRPSYLDIPKFIDSLPARRQTPKTAAMRDADAGLFAALRALRLRIAEKRGVPAYMIFNDAALRAMCALRPRTKEAFLEIPGVGEAKLRAYGDDFLQAIAQWEKIQER